MNEDRRAASTPASVVEPVHLAPVLAHTSTWRFSCADVVLAAGLVDVAKFAGLAVFGAFCVLVDRFVFGPQVEDVVADVAGDEIGVVCDDLGQRAA